MLNDSIYKLTGQTKRNSGDVVQYSYSYTYDDIGNRLTLTDQGSAVTTSTYNAGGQLIGTDASGTLTTYTYDASGNLQAQVTSAGTRSYAWDYDDRLIKQPLACLRLLRDVAGHLYLWTYENDGRAVTMRNKDRDTV